MSGLIFLPTLLFALQFCGFSLKFIFKSHLNTCKIYKKIEITRLNSTAQNLKLRYVARVEQYYNCLRSKTSHQ